MNMTKNASMLWSSDPTELGPMLANNKQTCNRELGHSFNKYWLRAGAKHSTGRSPKRHWISPLIRGCIVWRGQEKNNAGQGGGGAVLCVLSDSGDTRCCSWAKTDARKHEKKEKIEKRYHSGEVRRKPQPLPIPCSNFIKLSAANKVFLLFNSTSLPFSLSPFPLSK